MSRLTLGAWAPFAPLHPGDTIRYGSTCCVMHAGPWVQTTLPDGAVVHAVPQDGPEDRARAEALGYGGNVAHMTEDHDRLHALLAAALGLAESPALRGAVDGQESELRGLEEEVVLGLMRYVNRLRAEGLLRGFA